MHIPSRIAFTPASPTLLSNPIGMERSFGRSFRRSLVEVWRIEVQNRELAMALIKCPECGREVSREATACPQCGYPVAERLGTAAAAAHGDEALLEVRPSWWNFFWHFVFAWLIVPLVIAIWKRHALVLRVYPDRVKLERGVLSKEYRELFIGDIRSVDVDQGLLGRLLGMGDLTISTAATVDAAEIMNGLPNPLRIKDLIIAQRTQEGRRA